MDKVKNIILHITLFLFLLAALVMGCREAVTDIRQISKVELAEGWNVKFNDRVYENADLSNLSLPLAQRGDWLVLTTVLPEKLTTNGTLCIYAKNSVVTVYLDGEQIYEYGVEEFKNDLHVGFGNRFVSLPVDAAGKTLKITYLVTENNSFSTITVPVVYEEGSVMVDYLYGKRLYLGIGMALIVIGTVISLITFLLYFKSYSMDKLFCLGVFAVCIGFWTLCHQDLDYIFTSSLRIKSFIQFISFYLMLFPLLLFFREDVDRRARRLESLIYYAFLLIEIQMFAIAVILQVTNVLHFPDFETAYYCFIGVALIYILVLLIRNSKSEHPHIILLVGFFIELFAAARDLGVIMAIRYLGFKVNEGSLITFFPLASAIFVSFMFVDFIFEMRKLLYATAETEFLTKIAYEDVLTELHTRRKIEEYFAQIARRNQEFIIVQFDLNNLKTTNDTYGHEAGDALIVKFSNMLKTVFSSGEILGRMGGDEFIAIVRDSYGYDISERLKTLDKMIEEDGTINSEVKVSVSYGYCSSAEFDNPTVDEVYRTADKRMYACKEAYYRANGRGRRRYD